jgi:hypothetical protein
MRKLIPALFFSLISLSSNAQSTAYFKIADKGGVEKIVSSIFGYLTLGNDSVGHPVIVRWDNFFNPVWKLNITDTRVCGNVNQMIEAPDGSVYLGISTRNQSPCDGPLVVFKISSDGNVLWQRAYIGMQSPVLANASGNSNGFILSAGSCGYSGQIIRCDTNGTVVWHKQYYFRPNPQLTNEWNLHQISIVPDDTGYSFLSYYASAPQRLGHLFFRLNDSGSLVGSHKAYVNTPGENHQFTRMIRLEGNKGFACTGTILTTSFNTATVAFLDTAFNMISARKLTPGVMQFLLTDLVSTPSGNAIIACGRIYRGIGAAWEEGVILKMDHSGSMEWFYLPKPFNNGQNGKGISFTSMIPKNNRLFLASYESSDGATIAMLDSNGIGLCNAIDTAFQLQNLLFSIEDTLIQSILFTPADSAANLVYNREVHLNKFEFCGVMPGFSSPKPSFRPVAVYPVPAREFFVADPGEASDEAAPFRILDLQGKTILEGELSGPELIPATNWKSGMYLFQLLSEGRWYSVKFIIAP